MSTQTVLSRFFEPVASPAPKRHRKGRADLRYFQKVQMFEVLCGNSEEGPCPLCRKNVMCRTMSHTWCLAHVNGHARSGGNDEAWNVIPLCHACNQLAETGGRATEQRQKGAHLFDGVARYYSLHAKRFAPTLIPLMLRVYDWTLHALTVGKGAVPERWEDPAAVLIEFFASKTPGDGGMEDETGIIMSTFREYLAVRAEVCALEEDIPRLEASVEAKRERLRRLRTDRAHLLT